MSEKMTPEMVEAAAKWVRTSMTLYDPTERDRRLNNECRPTRDIIEALKALLSEWEERGQRITLLETSMRSHFEEEHLSGDGPEIDRWKSKVHDEEVKLLLAERSLAEAREKLAKVVEALEEMKAGHTVETLDCGDSPPSRKCAVCDHVFDFDEPPCPESRKLSEALAAARGGE